MTESPKSKSGLRVRGSGSNAPVKRSVLSNASTSTPDRSEYEISYSVNVNAHGSYHSLALIPVLALVIESTSLSFSPVSRLKRLFNRSSTQDLYNSLGSPILGRIVQLQDKYNSEYNGERALFLIKSKIQCSGSLSTA